MLPNKLYRARDNAVAWFLGGRKQELRSVRAQRQSSPAIESNLRGIGVGFKRRQGRTTKNLTLQFFVRHKYTLHSIPASERLPTEWEGAPTDVIEIGEVTPIGLRDRLRPVPIGCSIGVLRGIDATLGTLGAIVSRASDPTALAILSCSHVLTNWERFPLGSPVSQPAPVDGGTGVGDVVARVVKFAPLVEHRRGPFDAALADVVDTRLVVTAFGEPAPRVRSLSPIEPYEEMKVHKAGMVTGVTYGTAFSIGVDIEVNTEDPEIGFVMLEDQFLIRDGMEPFSDYGDSGALVFGTDEGRPAGLLTARSAQGFSVASRLSTLLSCFDVVLAR